MRPSILILLLAFFVLSISCSNKGEEQRVNVLLILVDTINADHLGCYGYHRNTSPTIDSLAYSGVRFANCYAQSSWTLPGMASIYTGLTERSHRCGHYNNKVFGLDLEVPTIATILQQNDYSTAGFVQSSYLGEDFNMEKGFDSFWISVTPGESGMDSVAIDTVLSFCNSSSLISKSFFLTVHLYDPHSPYGAPAPYDTLFKHTGNNGIFDWPSEEHLKSDPVIIEHLEAMYDSEIRWTDYQLSRLLAGLREMNLLDNTIVILVADHGEEFMEHGFTGHANNLYQQTTHVPLIISGPGIEPGTVLTANTGQFDVLPTLMNYLSISVPAHVEGIDILGNIPADRIIPSSGIVFGESVAACIQESMKVMWFPEADSSETYDLAEDPGEENMLDTNYLLFDEVQSSWAWPCICTPTQNDSMAMAIKELEELGYLR